MIIQDKTQPHIMPLIMALPLLASLLGLAFCAWIAFGNNVDICITAGCSLSSDMNIGGMSLWWFGCIAFSFLSVLSFSGRPWLGLFAAAICILLDTILLILMLSTAPCLSCLVVAVLFALVYLAFRHECLRNVDKEDRGRSWILLIWLMFFIGNTGAVLRDSMGPWRILGPETPAISLYFSPSCTHCLEAVRALSGNVQTAFYPIAEKPEDLNAIVHLRQFLENGDSMMDALEKARKKTDEATIGTFESLLLNFRLQRNKSHLVLAASSVVPFIEYRGLPTFLQDRDTAAQIRKTEQEKYTPTTSPSTSNSDIDSSENLDATLPFDTGDSGIAGSCGESAYAEPCPE